MKRKTMLLPVLALALAAAALLGPGAALADGLIGTSSYKSGDPK